MRKTIFLLATIIVFIAANFVTADTIEVDPATSLDSYISLGEWETPGDLDGFTQSADVTNLTVAGGTISGTVNGNDPSIRKDSAVGRGRYNLPVGSIIEIRIKLDADAAITNNADASGRFYFHNVAWQMIYFATKSDIQVDGAFHIYRVTISANLNFSWITRIDPYQTGMSGREFEIDYIRAKLPMMVDPVAVKSLAYTSVAEWNTPGDFEDWTVENMDAFVAAGYLTATNNSDGQVYKDNAAGLPMIDLDNNNIVEVRLRRGLDDAGAVDMFYGTTNTPGASSARMMRMDANTIPRDGLFHTYQFDWTTQSAWMGALQLIRFDPTYHGSKVVDIDYIHVGKVIPEPATFGFSCLLGLAFLRRK